MRIAGDHSEFGTGGQDLDEPCGNCDTCASGSAFAHDAGAADAGFTIDDRVTHRDWGGGTVMAVEDDRMTVFFESQGYKVLSLDLVEQNGVLERADA